MVNIKSLLLLRSCHAPNASTQKSCLCLLVRAPQLDLHHRELVFACAPHGSMLLLGCSLATG